MVTGAYCYIQAEPGELFPPGNSLWKLSSQEKQGDEVSGKAPKQHEFMFKSLSPLAAGPTVARLLHETSDFPTGSQCRFL